MTLPDTQTLLLAIAGGILPAIFWLWFWQKEDAKRPEPRGLVMFLFLAGMAGVVLVIPIQKFAYDNVLGSTILLAIWATAEEFMKFFAFFLVMARSRFLDEPVDYAVDMITVALGFAALENILFLIDPLENGTLSAGLLMGDFRFIGATLLHICASAVLGLFMGFAFYSGAIYRAFALIFGLFTAIALHTVFNFFIINYQGSILVVFGYLWVTAVIVMLLFEKIKQLR